MNNEIVIYEDEDLYVLEHEMDGRILYSAYEVSTDKPIVFNKPSVKEAVKAARKELKGVLGPSGRELDVQLAKQHGKRKRLPSGKILPNWLLLLHEETHNQLGHAPRLEGWTHGETPPHIIKEEEEVWQETAKELRDRGKWAPKTKEIAIEALGAYYDDTEKARRFIERL